MQWSEPLDEPLRAALDAGRVVTIPGVEHEVNLIYADQFALGTPGVRALLDRLQQRGWERLAPDQPTSEDWLLLGRSSPAEG